jgi:transcriptional regulator with XRE-family HTH domain
MTPKEQDKFRRRLGKRLRQLRMNYGISQDKLAVEASIGDNQIGNIERGEINATALTLAKIALVLNCEIQDFFVFEKE